MAATRVAGCGPPSDPATGGDAFPAPAHFRIPLGRGPDQFSPPLPMALLQLQDEQIRTWTRAQKDRWWFENVYRG
ncbi:MAG: hypothetical protein ACKOET_20100, partial [Verrucomicrobiota bacterium]